MRKQKVHSYIFAELDKVFYYSEESRTYLKHKIDKFGGIFGQVLLAIKDSDAGRIKPNGYASVKYKNIERQAHRVIYCLYFKIDLSDDLVIDHIDRNPLNNNISNLQLVTQSDNIKNKLHRKSNTFHQGISESTLRMNFVVSFRDKTGKVCKYFSYNPRGHKNNLNLYSTRNQALNAAIEYRDYLIKCGKITTN